MGQCSAGAWEVALCFVGPLLTSVLAASGLSCSLIATWPLQAGRACSLCSKKKYHEEKYLIWGHSERPGAPKEEQELERKEGIQES